MQDDKIKKIFQDENHKVQFDFSDAINVFQPHVLANLYSDYLSDVDFVLEEKEKLICLEYKNANIKNADNPKAFQQKLVEEAFWKKAVKKFYGTMFLVWACNKNPLEKPVQYVLLIESNPGMDNALKKRFIMKMMRQLPFKYNTRSEIRKKIIDEFCLMDLKEWGEKYPQYPICGLEMEKV